MYKIPNAPTFFWNVNLPIYIYIVIQLGIYVLVKTFPFNAQAEHPTFLYITLVIGRRKLVQFQETIYDWILFLTRDRALFRGGWLRSHCMVTLFSIFIYFLFFLVSIENFEVSLWNLESLEVRRQSCIFCLSLMFYGFLDLLAF